MAGNPRYGFSISMSRKCSCYFIKGHLYKKIYAYWIIILVMSCSSLPPGTTRYNKQFPMPGYESNVGANSYIYAPVERGFVVTKKNDTLKGLVKLIYYGNGDHIPVLPTGKKTATDIINIKRKDIDYIHVYDDTSMSIYKDYVNIDYFGLWRRLGINDKVGIYDNYEFMGRGQKIDGKELMVLVTGNQKEVMYHGFQTVFQSRYSYLLSFLNKRYYQHFKKNYFKDQNSEIEYILEKENENRTHFTRN